MLLKVWNGIRFVAAWLIAGALALVILAVGLDPFMLFFRVTLQASHWADQFLRDVFYMTGGLLWLIFFMLAEHWFTTATSAGRLLRCFLQIAGIEMSLLFLLRGIQMLYVPVTLNFMFFLTLFSGLLAAAMMYFGFRKQPAVLATK